MSRENHAHPTGGPSFSCEEAQREIDLLLEEEDLTESERALLFGHLRACVRCKAILDQRRRLDLRLRQGFKQLDTSPGFTDQVLDRLPAPGRAEESLDRKHPAWLEAARMVRTRRGASLMAGASFARWWARGYRLPTGIAVLIALGLCAAFLRSGGLGGDPDQAEPLVAEMNGSGVLERGGKPQPLEAGKFLKDGDVVIAGSDLNARPLSLKLASGATAWATVHLNPGARLHVHSRSSYKLELGEAYFEVNSERSQAPDTFTVELHLGRVQVIGTVFGVIVPAVNSNRETVVVDKGKVRVRPNSGTHLDLSAGEECDLLPGRVSSLRLIAAGRLAWITERAAPLAAASPLPEPAFIEPGIAQRPEAEPAPPTREVRLGDPIDLPIDFRGMTLPEALECLERAVGGAANIRDLARQARAAGATQTPSRFQLRHPLTLRSIVGWLLRENGLRLTADGRLRRSEPFEDRESGMLPEPIAASLAREELGSLLDRAGAEGRNLYVEGQDPAQLKTLPDGYACAWIDNVIYAGPAERIERMTRIERRIGARHLTGDPALPEWQEALENVLRAMERAQPEGERVERLEIEAGEVVCVAGLGAWNRLTQNLEALAEAAPGVASPAAALHESSLPGTIRSLKELAQAAARQHVEVRFEQDLEFPSGAFLSKSLDLCETLEWAVRLHDKGLRSEAGALVVDAPQACYGVRTIQVVSLEALTREHPVAQRELPAALARHAVSWFPELLKGVALYPLQDRLVFLGDRRELGAVQKVAQALAADLRERPKDFDLAVWTPAWRKHLDADLAQPFGTATGGQIPEGTFAGLLRSGLFVGLQASVLVDPPTMRRVATQRIPATDMQGRSVGETLTALAQAVGLRIAIEDGVLWLREGP